MSATTPDPNSRIALFQKKEIRRTLHQGEWWFVVTDVIAALTDSVNPSDYLKKLRKRDASLSEAFKGGGDNLSPPLGCRSIQREAPRLSNAGIQKASFA